jgi:hypothetical protein
MEDNDKTRLIRRSSAQPPPLPPEAASHPADPDQTRILVRPEIGGESSPTPNPIDDDKTVILSPPARAHAQGEAPLSDAMSDPLVGWLVIISGPGQGNALRLGHGMNSIGRAEGQRCRIDFGDVEISRKTHASVTYDPRGRKFYLMHGGGQNLTYLGDEPVLAPALLKGGEVISIGKTTLKFIPLCGPDFDWS